MDKKNNFIELTNPINIHIGESILNDNLELVSIESGSHILCAMCLEPVEEFFNLKLTNTYIIQLYFSELNIYFDGLSLSLSSTKKSLFKIFLREKNKENTSSILIENESYQFELIDQNYERLFLGVAENKLTLIQNPIAITLKNSVFKECNNKKNESNLKNIEELSLSYLKSPFFLEYKSEKKYLCIENNELELKETPSISNGALYVDNNNHIRSFISNKSFSIYEKNDKQYFLPKKEEKSIKLENDSVELKQEFEFHFYSPFQVFICSEKLCLQCTEGYIRMGEYCDIGKQSSSYDDKTIVSEHKLNHLFQIKLLEKKYITQILPLLKFHTEDQNAMLRIFLVNIEKCIENAQFDEVRYYINEIIANNIFETYVFDEKRSEEILSLILCSFNYLPNETILHIISLSYFLILSNDPQLFLQTIKLRINYETAKKIVKSKIYFSILKDKMFQKPEYFVLIFLIIRFEPKLLEKEILIKLLKTQPFNIKIGIIEQELEINEFNYNYLELECEIEYKRYYLELGLTKIKKELYYESEINDNNKKHCDEIEKLNKFCCNFNIMTTNNLELFLRLHFYFIEFYPENTSLETYEELLYKLSALETENNIIARILIKCLFSLLKKIAKRLIKEINKERTDIDVKTRIKVALKQFEKYINGSFIKFIKMTLDNVFLSSANINSEYNFTHYSYEKEETIIIILSFANIIYNSENALLNINKETNIIEIVEILFNKEENNIEELLLKLLKKEKKRIDEETEKENNVNELLLYLFTKLKENKSKYSQQEIILHKEIIHQFGVIVDYEVYNRYKDYILKCPEYNVEMINLILLFKNALGITFEKEFCCEFADSLYEKVHEIRKLLSFLNENQEEEEILLWIELLTFLSVHSNHTYLFIEEIGLDSIFQYMKISNKVRIRGLNLLCDNLKSYTKWDKRTDLFMSEEIKALEKNELLMEEVELLLRLIKIKTEVINRVHNSYHLYNIHKKKNENETNAIIETYKIEGTDRLFVLKIADWMETNLSNEKINEEILLLLKWISTTFKIELQGLNKFIAVPNPIKEKYCYNPVILFAPTTIPTKSLFSEIHSETLFELFNTFLYFSYNAENLIILLQLLNSIFENNLITSEKEIINFIELLFKMQFHPKIENNKKTLYSLHFLCNTIAKKNIIFVAHFQEFIIKYENKFFLWFQNMLNAYGKISPLIIDENFPEIQKYEFEEALQKSKEQYSINKSLGIHTLNYFTLQFCESLSLLTTLSHSLNFSFKILFRSSINALMKLFSEESLKNISYDKLTILYEIMNLINALLQGPVKDNIETVIKYNFNHLLFSILNLSERPQQSEKEETPSNIKLHCFLIEVKIKVMQIIFFLHKSEQEIKLLKDILESSYEKCKNYDYGKESKRKHNLEKAYFELSLHTFYILLNEGSETIKQIQLHLLKEKHDKRRNEKLFKVFYQIYNIGKEMIHKKSVKNSKEEALYFFIRHTASVDVKMSGSISRIHFFLLNETYCVSKSTRKEFHRNVGVGRDRLTKMMQTAEEILLRMEIQYKVYSSAYFLTNIILKNRQLWKSLNFATAVVFNALFIFEENLNINAPVEYSMSLIAVSIFSYVFSIFLLIVYFLESVPLKIAVADSRKYHSFSRLFFILGDKTLFFSLFYITIVSLTFVDIGFCAFLMIDFFNRFKVSHKVTVIIINPISSLFLVFLLFVCIINIFAMIGFLNRSVECQTLLGCFQMFIKNSFELNNSEYEKGSTKEILTVIPRYLLHIGVISLIVGVMLSEKKSNDLRVLTNNYQITKLCFICGQERSDVDRTRNSNTGFFNHIEMEHNLWNYVFYLLYLKNKSKNSLNAIEEGVLEQWHKHLTEWLPDRIS